MSDEWRKLQRISKELVEAGNTHGWIPHSVILQLLGERDRLIEQVALAQGTLSAQKNYMERQQRIIQVLKEYINPKRGSTLAQVYLDKVKRIEDGEE